MSMLDRLINIKMLICKDSSFHIPKKDMGEVKYSISLEYFDNFIKWLSDMIPKNVSEFADRTSLSRVYVNDIYKCIRDNGFLDKYLSLQFDHTNTGLYVEIILSFEETLENIVNSLNSSMEKIHILQLMKTRVMGIKFLKKFIFEQNIQEDVLRYEDLDNIIEDVLENIEMYLERIDDNKTPMYVSTIPYTDPSTVHKNTVDHFGVGAYVTMSLESNPA